MNKYNNIKAICRIPRPRITPAAARNTPEQSIEMNVIKPIQEMGTEQILQEIANPFHVQVFNITQYNKNLISFPGISFLVTYFLLMTGLAIGSRYGWISLVQLQLYIGTLVFVVFLSLYQQYTSCEIQII